jgi:hypothetical protein
MIPLAAPTMPRLELGQARHTQSWEHQGIRYGLFSVPLTTPPVTYPKDRPATVWRSLVVLLRPTRLFYFSNPKYCKFGQT